jgi:hypothetical protein
MLNPVQSKIMLVEGSGLQPNITYPSLGKNLCKAVSGRQVMDPMLSRLVASQHCGIYDALRYASLLSALCPMLYALCSMLYALCSMPSRLVAAHHSGIFAALRYAPLLSALCLFHPHHIPCTQVRWQRAGLKINSTFLLA